MRRSSPPTAFPPSIVGLDRFDARKKVVADLEALGVLDHVEAKTIQMPYGDRSGVVIEPWLTDQWYVNAGELAKPALAAVRSGETAFVPKTWEKTYFNWMENIQPWCVSRQLWWGHQIPAWYAPDGRCFVAESEAEAQAQAGEGVPLTRDEDVLDTWFSSALWPFATLGWPENTADLARHYPGDVLVTGFDIIFFWVARMMMQGIHFMDEVPPFKTRLLPWPRPRRQGPEDVEVEGQHRRSAGAGRQIWRRRAALHARPRWKARAATSSSMKSASKAIATSRPSCGTPRASASRTAFRARPTSRRRPPRHAVNRWIIGEVAATAQGARSRHGEPSASMPMPTPSTSSSGTASATGIWS